MSTETSFDDLMHRLRRGDNEAADTVFQCFVGRLVALARSRLDSQIRPKEDPEDVVQSVFRSFFNRQVEGRFDIDCWDNLWGLLTLITLRKCCTRNEHYRALRRDLAVEQHDSDEALFSWEAIARDPTPSHAIALSETLEQLVHGLDACGQQIVSLRLQEFTIVEISERVGRAERTVRRTLDRVKRRLERMQQVL